MYLIGSNQLFNSPNMLRVKCTVQGTNRDYLIPTNGEYSVEIDHHTQAVKFVSNERSTKYLNCIY